MVDNIGEDGGIAVDGDYEGLITRRQEDQEPQNMMVPTTKKSSAPSAHEKAFQSLKDKKWSLTNAILIYGTLDQVQQWAHSAAPTNTEEWTETTLEAERVNHAKKFDVATRTSTHKLYMAFTILEKAAHKLELNGASNKTFREAVGWFIKFVSKNDGLRVKGISSGSSSLAGVNVKESALSLSLLGSQGMVPAAVSSSKSNSSSLATELHRLRQYASLGSAILYLSAKRTGVGRTLIEVCSAFGTYTVINSNIKMDSSAMDRSNREAEPLVRPKYCSRAMQELRAVLPEVVLPSGGGGGGLATTQEMAATLPSSTSPSDLPMKTEEEARALPVKVTPSYGLPEAPSSTSFTPTAASFPAPVKSEYIPNAESSASRNSSHTVNNTEEAALADLLSRMGTSLNLPTCAISAATAVAIQCARDARASAQALPSKRNNSSNGKAHLRPGQRRVKPSRQSKDAAPDVIAIASLLLVCTAGGTMQRLARQALSNAVSTSSSTGNQKFKSTEGTQNNMSNPLDDLQDELSPSSTPKSDMIGSTTSTTTSTTAASAQLNPHATVEQRALSSWTAWNTQQPWHRDVSHMEQCTGVPRKTIIAYYSNVLHPRRSYFLGVAAKKKEDGTAAAGLLLHNIVAAVPLMSLRNL